MKIETVHNKIKSGVSTAERISKNLGPRQKQIERKKWHQEMERRREEAKKIEFELIEAEKFKKERKFKPPQKITELSHHFDDDDEEFTDKFKKYRKRKSLQQMLI